MSKIPKGESLERQQNKNIKNIYVHKINSLIKLSRDNLASQEAAEMLCQNKMQALTETLGLKRKLKRSIQKVNQILAIADKTALKLEKNRESARKARQRKNLYIKLLQNQVVFLRKQLSQSQQIEASSSKYLAQIKNSSKSTQQNHKLLQIEDDLDRYLSHDNIGELKQDPQLNQKKIQKIGQVISQFQDWFVPQLLKSINNLKKESQRLQLNKKIIKNAENQYKNEHPSLQNNIQQSQIRLLLPFQQQTAQLKITNIFKTLSKSMQQLKILLEKVNQISNQLKQLIMDQETNDIEISQFVKNRIKYLINQYRVYGVGDRLEKVLERILRWSQFPNVNMLTTMQKIVQFNKFIEKTIVQENIIQEKQEEKERSQESQIDEEQRS